MKKYKVGYTQGVFDMFHVGHLNLINQAKLYCDYLMVGVNSDELVEIYKLKKPVIPQEQRKMIVENLKAVDECFIVDTLDKEQINEMHPFDAIFIGDDWKGNERWEKTGLSLGKKGIDLVYLPYTSGISSTILRTEKNDKVDEY